MVVGSQKAQVGEVSALGQVAGMLGGGAAAVRRVTNWGICEEKRYSRRYGEPVPQRYHKQ